VSPDPSAGLCVPPFALLAAGVPVGADALRAVVTDPVAVAVLAGLLVGEPIGMFGASWLTVRLTPAVRPGGLGWRDLLAVSMLGGVGFTVSLLLAELSLASTDTGLVDRAKAAVLLASAVASLLGAALLALRGRAHRRTPGRSRPASGGPAGRVPRAAELDCPAHATPGRTPRRRIARSCADRTSCRTRGTALRTPPAAVARYRPRSSAGSRAECGDPDDVPAGGNEVANPTPGGRGTEVPTPLRSIPLSAEPSVNGDASIGGLVREASSHVSTLLRAELELAKQEVTAEVKKGVQGSVFFLVALTIVLFSLFFFFIAVAELLTIWLMPWAAYLVVFGIMLVVAGLAGLIGFLRVRKIHAPERTISSVKDTAAALGRRGGRDGAPALER
jgi:hypothetical protein